MDERIWNTTWVVLECVTAAALIVGASCFAWWVAGSMQIALPADLLAIELVTISVLSALVLFLAIAKSTPQQIDAPFRGVAAVIYAVVWGWMVIESPVWLGPPISKLGEWLLWFLMIEWPAEWNQGALLSLVGDAYACLHLDYLRNHAWQAGVAGLTGAWFVQRLSDTGRWLVCWTFRGIGWAVFFFIMHGIALAWWGKIGPPILELAARLPDPLADLSGYRLVIALAALVFIFWGSLTRLIFFLHESFEMVRCWLVALLLDLPVHAAFPRKRPELANKSAQHRRANIKKFLADGTVPPLRKEIHFPKQREHVVRTIVEEEVPELIKEFVEFPRPTASYEESPMVLEQRCLPTGPEEAIGQYVRLNFEKQLTTREQLREAFEKLTKEQRKERATLRKEQRDKLRQAPLDEREDLKLQQREEREKLEREQREAREQLRWGAQQGPQERTWAAWRKRMRLSWNHRRTSLWLHWERLFAHPRPEETIVLLLARAVDAAVLADRHKDTLRQIKQWNAMPFYERIFAEYKRIWFPFDCLLAPVIGSEMRARVVIETHYEKVFLQALFGDRKLERARYRDWFGIGIELRTPQMREREAWAPLLHMCRRMKSHAVGVLSGVIEIRYKRAMQATLPKDANMRLRIMSSGPLADGCPSVARPAPPPPPSETLPKTPPAAPERATAPVPLRGSVSNAPAAWLFPVGARTYRNNGALNLVPDCAGTCLPGQEKTARETAAIVIDPAHVFKTRKSASELRRRFWDPTGWWPTYRRIWSGAFFERELGVVNRFPLFGLQYPPGCRPFGELNFFTIPMLGRDLRGWFAKPVGMTVLGRELEWLFDWKRFGGVIVSTRGSLRAGNLLLPEPLLYDYLNHLAQRQTVLAALRPMACQGPPLVPKPAETKSR